jgi:hypothetical protein
MMTCQCGRCHACKQRAWVAANRDHRRAYNRAWMRDKRAEAGSANVPYTCLCGNAGKRGGCRRCGMSYARNGYVKPPREVA